MTDTMVVDVSQDWEIACDVQERFMHHAVPTLTASATALVAGNSGRLGDVRLAANREPRFPLYHSVTDTSSGTSSCGSPWGGRCRLQRRGFFAAADCGG